MGKIGDYIWLSTKLLSCPLKNPCHFAFLSTVRENHHWFSVHKTWYWYCPWFWLLQFIVMCQYLDFIYQRKKDIAHWISLVESQSLVYFFSSHFQVFLPSSVCTCELGMGKKEEIFLLHCILKIFYPNLWLVFLFCWLWFKKNLKLTSVISCIVCSWHTAWL